MAGSRDDQIRTGCATSASWRTSMPVKPPPPSGCCTTPGSITKSVKCMKAPRRWTGWCRSRSAASLSPRLRPPVSGATIVSILSIRPDTSISPSRSSAACACSTARWRCSARSAESSRNPKPYGARPTSIGFRAIAFVNKMDRVGADFEAWSAKSATSSRPSRCLLQYPDRRRRKVHRRGRSGREPCAIWDEDRLGANYRVEEIPAELTEKRAGLARQDDRDAGRPRREDHGALPGRQGRRVAPKRCARRSAPPRLNIEIIPVVMGSAFSNKGVQPMLDAVVDYLPSPIDVPPVVGHRRRQQGKEGRALAA